jgi:hypothetical protein
VSTRRIVELALGTLVIAGVLGAQVPDSASPPLAFGLRIGDRPRVVGVRVNYRDDALRSVYGANFTVWEPRHDTIGGNVYGLALGLPVMVPGYEVWASERSVLLGTGSCPVSLSHRWCIPRAPYAGS